MLRDLGAAEQAGTEVHAGRVGEQDEHVVAGARQRILRERPDVLLTTPESLEAMLVSAKTDHKAFFGGLQAIVVDEVHAFAGDDRGWHLLAVLERLTHLIGRPVQRIGLSATVGNPAELLDWLQGSGQGTRPAQVITPEPVAVIAGEPPPGEIELDYVGSIGNAAKVIAALHAGEKRLVFCDSRRLVEEIGAALRAKGVTTFLSHASLAHDERRRSEEAFAEARDCVIVSTSTLELGIDVGDLDRVIQVNAPMQVASFLQRLGRTGRRSGSTRNCLFLALDGPALAHAAGLLTLWGRHWVEPVSAPPEPRHIVAQQVLALCLQEGRVGDRVWPEWWNGLDPFGTSAAPIVRHLVEAGFLDSDSGMLFIGPEAERRFGHRHFMNVTAVFTAAPEFTVLSGRTEIGRMSSDLLTEEVVGPRLLLLGGRSWHVTYIDWSRRRCFVEPADQGGRARWTGIGGILMSRALSRGIRDVLLGSEVPVRLTRRASEKLAELRAEATDVVHPGGTLIVRESAADVRWWTWAGHRTNATLIATLGNLADPVQRIDEFAIRLREDLTVEMWREGTADIADRICLPEVNPKAVAGLKFNAALPERLAVATLAARLADVEGALEVLKEPVRFVLR